MEKIQGDLNLGHRLTKVKEKILKAARKKRFVICKQSSIRSVAEFSSKTIEAENRENLFLKSWGGGSCQVRTLYQLSYPLNIK